MHKVKFFQVANMLVQQANVPYIDISLLSSDDNEKKQKVVKQIHDASCGSGFFWAINHGIDTRKLQTITDNFHQSVTDEESWNLAIRAYNINNVKQIRNGFYLPIKGKKAVKSYCILNPNFSHNHPRIKACLPMHEVNVWPDKEKHPEFRTFYEKYYWEVFDLTLTLLRGYALALGKEENFFDQYFSKDDTLSSVSLIQYPYIYPYPENAIKTASDGTKLSFDWHYDVSVITVLFQSNLANLQVETLNEWQDIPSSENAYLVNVGTYMTHITDNYFLAPKHRVKWINAKRLSIPFFCSFGHYSTIEPFVPFHPEQKAKNNKLSYGDYLYKGLESLIVKNGQT